MVQMKLLFLQTLITWFDSQNIHERINLQLTLFSRVNERLLLIGGLICCFLGFFVYLPWGNDYPSSQMASKQILI